VCVPYITYITMHTALSPQQQWKGRYWYKNTCVIKYSSYFYLFIFIVENIYIYYINFYFDFFQKHFYLLLPDSLPPISPSSIFVVLYIGGSSGVGKKSSGIPCKLCGGPPLSPPAPASAAAPPSPPATLKPSCGNGAPTSNLKNYFTESRTIFKNKK